MSDILGSLLILLYASVNQLSFVSPTGLFLRSRCLHMSEYN